MFCLVTHNFTPPFLLSESHPYPSHGKCLMSLCKQRNCGAADTGVIVSLGNFFAYPLWFFLIIDVCFLDLFIIKFMNLMNMYPLLGIPYLYLHQSFTFIALRDFGILLGKLVTRITSHIYGNK